MRTAIAVISFVAVLMVLWLFIPQSREAQDSFSVGEVLGGIAEEGFEQAIAPRLFRFPQDHGAHPSFRSEWWYFTGNLETAQGRRFGFQLVFFRNALAPGKAIGESAWRTHQSWMAHFALTDVRAGRFQAFERLSRGAVGLAGASQACISHHPSTATPQSHALAGYRSVGTLNIVPAMPARSSVAIASHRAPLDRLATNGGEKCRSAPFEVWLDDWSLTMQEERWRLHAKEGGLSITLSLNPLRQPVLQGEAGLSQKSAEPGNASYYYSIPRLRAGGEVVVDGQSHQVGGLAWLDREWSTSALGEDQAGWDWFSLQFDNGSDLMFYRLRRKDGGVDPHSAGSWVEADGRVIKLGSNDVVLDALEHWSSPKGGSYPVRWRIRIPALDVDIKVTPVIKNQELDLLVRYWEGAVDVTGTRARKPVQGRGYLELAGYDE